MNAKSYCFFFLCVGLFLRQIIIYSKLSNLVSASRPTKAIPAHHQGQSSVPCDQGQERRGALYASYHQRRPLKNHAEHKERLH